MTDKKLLELAAKAAGYVLVWGDEWKVGNDIVDCTDMAYIGFGQPDTSDVYWNPIEDDGDALRLAVKLGISIMPYPLYTQPKHSVVAEVKQRLVDTRVTPEKQLPLNAVRNEHVETYGTDPYAATRRAVVRAAAEIGKSI